MERKNLEQFMRLALKLARKGQGFVNPNPLVGAVVVKKGRILSQGYHKKSGSAHAEVVALEKAADSARGATLYVNLEPCCHFGKTPPCVDKILSSGIREVVFAMHDPNPLNRGKGALALRRAGVKVLSGVLEEEAKKINQVFIKYITRQLPFVTVKVAQSLDGKIATSGGDSRWISSEKSRKFVHKLRAEADAVLVGIDTLLKDNPLLSCRLNGQLYKRQPKKVIVDSKLRIRPGLRIFSSHSPAQVIIATTKFAPQAKVLAFQKKAQVVIAKDKQSRVQLQDLFRKLARRGITHLLIEGGGEIIASALRAGLVDRMIVFVSSKIIGGRNAPTAVEGQGARIVKEAIGLKDMKVRTMGSDLIIKAKL